MKNSGIVVGMLSALILCTGCPGGGDGPHDLLNPPALLSETGVFEDLAALKAGPGFLDYKVAVSLWSDGALKKRWIHLPEGTQLGFQEQGPWEFPVGTAFVKHFELNVGALAPLRLETRFLVRGAGGWKAYTYRWNSKQTDAELLKAGADQLVDVADASAPGGIRKQLWKYPSPADCMSCHNAGAGTVLGVRTAQLNSDHTYADGTVANQLKRWDELGYFAQSPDPSGTRAEYADPADEGLPLEPRVRSYLAVNCAHCHQPQGTVGYLGIDYRADTPLDQVGVVGVAPLVGNLGVPDAQRVFPGHPEKSVLWLRMTSTTLGTRMPYLGSTVLDPVGVNLFRDWIESL